MIITNEIEPLSNDLTTITTEIKSYENIAGRSIFEIGRRLKWVKDHDLAHGQFMDWYQGLGMTKDFVSKTITVANKLNFVPSRNLGIEALYQIATLPEEDRNKEFTTKSGETKKPDEMTVRELRELKKQLKRKKQELADRDETIASQNEELEANRKTQIQLNNQLREVSNKQLQPKVITKTITKEVPIKPDDYDEIKSKVVELKKQLAKNNENIEYYKRELKAAERINKNANSYDKLQKQELERKKRQAEINGYSTSLSINDWIPELQKLGQADIDQMGEQAQKNLSKRLELLQQSIDRLSAMLNGRRIIEGDYRQ